MKTIHALNLLFISPLLLASFTACYNSDDMLWDFTPIEPYIQVQDTHNKQEVYEGVTDYYQTKHPDSKIKETVRLQMNKYSPT